MDVRRLQREDVELVRRIDRSEHVEVEYTVVDGRLVERPVTMAEIPRWEESTGENGMDAHVSGYARDVEDHGIFLGAFEGDDLAGLAVVKPRFEPPMAQLAALHVSRPFRRRGAASALWDAASAVAADAGAATMYVSATPTGSAVGFYLSRGCVLAVPPHPALLALEPDDVHLICDVRRG
jgi:predicted N-acetyltransferase YhbS